MKIDILAIGVHPDDVELCAAGTLLRHAAAGHSFGLLDLTRGELGTRGNATLRTEEALRSAQLLGAAFREQLDILDGLFTWSDDNLRKIIRVIRHHRPEVVLCNAVEDRHPDHGRAAKLSADACFLAGLPKIETSDADGTPQTAWRPRAVFHYIQDKVLRPDFVVDITPWFEKKMEAVLAYRSQFYDATNPDAPETPISGKDFLDYLEAQSRVMGRPAQVHYAEGFICARTPAVDSFFDLT